jgi:hypothetical protein
MKIQQILSVLFITFMILSCNEENPLLVNPASKSETVRVRFINLGMDKNSKSLEFEGVKTPEIPYALSSEAMKPLYDSAMMKVYSGSAVEFELQQQVKFLRKTNYTYIGLSSNPAVNKIDTLITLRTSAALPDNPVFSLVKFFNAYIDSNVRYSIRLGCPNGEQLFFPIPYKQYSIIPETVHSGSFSISLVKTNITDSLSLSSKLYQLNIDPSKQYTLIVTKNIDGTEKLLLLDENEMSPNALQEVLKINDSERNSFIRTINLSSNSNIDVLINNEPLTSSRPSMTIDKFITKALSCNSIGQDIITTSVGGVQKGKNPASLEVMQKYSLIVFDSANGDAGKSLLIEPLKLSESTSGKAVIRVVNAAKDLSSLTVSLGARKDIGSTISSGTILADTLNFGFTSEPKVLSEGVAPLSIFTSEPSKLLYSTRVILEMNKTYLLIILNDDNGNVVTTLINDTDEQKSIDLLKEGVFLQLVNAYTGMTDVKITFNSQSGEPSVLQDSKVSYSNSIATVIEPKSQTIVVEGISYTVDAELNKRILIVVTGDSKSIQIISDKSEPMTKAQEGKFRYRFVNAALDIPIVKIKNKDDTTSTIEDAIDSKLFGSYKEENKDRKITYYFYDGDNNKYILRLGDVPLNLNKSYSIILTGFTTPGCYREYDKNNTSKEPNCYDIIVQQEF